MPTKRKNPAAVALGRKGGEARLTKMSAEERKRRLKEAQIELMCGWHERSMSN
jgi:hypothetical protein